MAIYINQKYKRSLPGKVLYSFDILPVPKPRMTQSDKWNERKPVTNYFAFKQELRLKANLKKFRIGEQLNVIFYIPTKNMLLWGKPHREQKPDGDNLLKAFIDAMTDQDHNIWDGHYRKYWSEKPRIDVLEPYDLV